MELNGYDIDGTITGGIELIEPYVIISGRVIDEYDDFVKQLAQKAPVYIRYNVQHRYSADYAGLFKSQMINILGVTTYYEDDEYQAEIIKNNCPNCKVILFRK
jgi:hypothetical protein